VLAAAIMRDGKEGVLILNFFSFFYFRKKAISPTIRDAFYLCSALPPHVALGRGGGCLVQSFNFCFLWVQDCNHNDSRKYNTEVQRAPQAKHNSEYRLCYLTN